MPVIAVTSTEPGVGKTGVAAAVARSLAYGGTPVRLLRIADDGESAAADAAWFGAQDWAPGSPTSAVVASAVAAAGDETLVVEVDAVNAAAVHPDAVILVARGAAPKGVPGGLPVTSVVVTAAHGAVAVAVGAVPVVALEEDRALAGFSVSEARALLNAEVLVEGDSDDPTCDYLVVAPIGSDAGEPYLRRFKHKAVVCRFDKTDMHLAALRSEVNCLILTGGRRPSDYLFDAAAARGVPVLLAATDTENTVIALEGVFDRTRFRGERKLERMSQLLAGTVALNPLG